MMASPCTCCDTCLRVVSRVMRVLRRLRTCLCRRAACSLCKFTSLYVYVCVYVYVRHRCRGDDGAGLCVCVCGGGVRDVMVSPRTCCDKDLRRSRTCVCKRAACSLCSL